MWLSGEERHKHRQALCKRLLHNWNPCEQCNIRVVLMVPKHSRRTVQEARHRSGKYNIQRDTSQEYEAWYNSPRTEGMQCEQSFGPLVEVDSASEGTRFRLSRPSRPEHLGVSDGN
jgi:hypothetical protein